MQKVNLSDNWLFYPKSSHKKISVVLPHDAMINETRSPDAKSKGACAYFEGGVYCYEKELFIPESWRGKVLTLEFEGVYRNSAVFVNGNKVGGHPYGYSGFYVDITEAVEFGENNSILVEADNSQAPNSRWYSGSGIYRPVHLCVKNKSHIELDGIKITTISIDPPQIQVETAHTGGSITVEIFDKDAVIACGQGDCASITIPNAKLWSDESPYLYQCRVTLENNGQVTDIVTENFGVRKITWDNHGLYINGKSTLLRGGCVHHDNGILGAACYEEAEWRRIRILKEYGFNAIRSAHNPISKAMLRACDALGMYVVDEAFDMWYTPKNPHDYALNFQQWYEADITAMVKKDQNHPSVIMFSIGNENTEPSTEQGVLQARKLTELIHSLNETIPVTAGVNLSILFMASLDAKADQNPSEEEVTKNDSDQVSGSTFFNMLMANMSVVMNNLARLKAVGEAAAPFFDELDISGYNYGSGRYAKEGKHYPQRLLYGSETMPFDIARNWKAVTKYPYIVGDFMWTAWDYLGEVGIGGWWTEPSTGLEKPYPWIIADSGALDILGSPTGEAALAKTVWGYSKEPMIFVRPMNAEGKPYNKAPWRGTNSIPSWSWAGCEGQSATVEVYSDAYMVQLCRDGKPIARKKLKDCCAKFRVSYSPGTLIATAYDRHGKALAKSRLSSAKGKLTARLAPEKDSAVLGEVLFVHLNIVGENGATESNRDEHFRVTVENGQLLAFGSAVQATEEYYSSGYFPTRYGKAMAVLKATEAGNTIRITAQSDFGMTAYAEIPVE